MKQARNCDCTFCTITVNTRNDIYELCFCCNKKLYLLNKCLFRCYDCNSILCENCYLQGRYEDDTELFCFNCRRFSIHKNAQYYFPNSNFFDMQNDWMFASWYY